jgi:hypothetical protein
MSDPQAHPPNQPREPRDAAPDARAESRQRARAKLRELIAELRSLPSGPDLEGLVEVAEGLERAIEAFHLEGIRFRMYTLDHRLRRLPASPGATRAREHFTEVRTALEQAGFHTRSH